MSTTTATHEFEPGHPIRGLCRICNQVADVHYVKVARVWRCLCGTLVQCGTNATTGPEEDEPWHPSTCPDCGRDEWTEVTVGFAAQKKAANPSLPDRASPEKTANPSGDEVGAKITEIQARLDAATPGPMAEHKYIGYGAGETGLSPAVYFHHNGFEGVYAWKLPENRIGVDLSKEINEANYQLALHGWGDIDFLLNSYAANQQRITEQQREIELLRTRNQGNSMRNSIYAESSPKG